MLGSGYWYIMHSLASYIQQVITVSYCQCGHPCLHSLNLIYFLCYLFSNITVVSNVYIKIIKI